jgi:DNA-binding transcriptional LysR family regulator
MELKQLRYFLYVAEEKSLLSASKRLYISHQALSKVIQGLEQELNTQLFFRSRSGVELTPAGIGLLDNALQVVTDADALRARFDTVNDSAKKTLRFGITYGLLDFFPVNMVLEFEQRYPEWTLSIIEDTDKNIEQDILSDRLDIGCISGLSINGALECQLIARSKAILAMHRDNPLSQLENLRLIDLFDQVFLTTSSDNYMVKALADACKAVGFSPQVGYQTTNRELVVQLLERNKGIFACAQNVLPWFTRPSIVVRSIEGDPFAFQLSLVSKKGTRPSRAATEFSGYFTGLIDNDRH